MVLRLVLVGLVAGLGFTFPGRSDIDTLSRSAQRWVRAQVAAWEARTSPREATFVFLANVPAPAPSEAAQPVVSDQVFTALVDEMVVEFARAELASLPRDAEESLKPAVELAPVQPSESLAIAPPSEPAIAEPAVNDLAFQAIVDEMASTFTADLAAVQHAPASDLEINELVDQLALQPAMVVTPLARSTSADHGAVAPEPVDVTEELYAGEAYALNRISEFPESMAPASAPTRVVVEEAPSRQSRLTNAVRLTREAVYAWTSLLHGPAVVTLNP